jgi:hypothetical protein
MTELNFYELAKQGNPQAIAFLLEANLQSVGIAIAVNLNGDCLDVIFESEQVPAQDKFVEFVRSELTDLQPDSISKVKVEGRETGQDAVWSQEFTLNNRSFYEQTIAEESVANTTVEPPSNDMKTNSYIQEKPPELTGFEHRLRSTLILVGIVTGILAIAVVTFVTKTLNESAAKIDQNSENTASLTTAPDPFREAVNSALRAAELGRSAKTKEDWTLVAERWQEAVSLMRRVPVSSPNYQVAQTKVVEYQKYLLYAQESAVNPPPQSPSPETADPKKSEKSQSKKSNSETETSEKVKSKKSNSEKSNSEKATSEESNPQKSNSETAKKK